MLAESTRGNRVRDLPERIAIRPKNSAVLETRLHKPSILPKTFFRSLQRAGLGKLLGLWPEDHKTAQLQNAPAREFKFSIRGTVVRR